MATRTVPTADALAELLTGYLASTYPRNAIAAPLEKFLRYAQSQLRTNALSARLWVKNVAVADGAPFRIVQAQYGVPAYQLAPQSRPDGAFLYENKRVGWFDNFDTEVTPKLSDDGVLLKHMGDSDKQFVIPVATLTNLVIDTAKRHDEFQAKRAADRAAELDAIEADHGEGIALLRGLLHAAGIPRNNSTLNIRRHSFFEGKETSTHISVDLTGEQVDLLAPVLRELGVKARRRAQPGNAGTDLKRAPVKADTAAE